MQHIQAPYLRAEAWGTQLIVDGAPYLVLGGELHNSSSSSLAYMEPIWERLTALHVNTVLAAVAWEMVEPEEDMFDWALVDGLLHGARTHGLRLILLWFGSWKNGTSSYVPAWVKRDPTRFGRVRLANGQPVEVLSVFEAANAEADARAFGALMAHLRDADGDTHTVIMVQVENEVGVLGASRDQSALANAAYADMVPAQLSDYLRDHQAGLSEGLRAVLRDPERTTGTWAEVFGIGDAADEVFMAWHYARYIDTVAARGKAAYTLPLFVNAWLTGESSGNWPSGGAKPGDWPSGGPLPQTFDVWKAGAPHIDFLAPDIYFGDFAQWCMAYGRPTNPLFVPEMRRDAEGVVQVFNAIGTYNALGTSPFGVDSIDDPALSALTQAYGLLRQLAPLILAHRGDGSMFGFVLDADQPSTMFQYCDYCLRITFDQGFGATVEHAHGILIALGDDRFIGAGYGFSVSFTRTEQGEQVGIVAVEEGSFEAGEWQIGRRLNGDENGSGMMWRFPGHGERSGVIPTLGPGTAISICSVYRF